MYVIELDLSDLIKSPNAIRYVAKPGQWDGGWMTRTIERAKQFKTERGARTWLQARPEINYGRVIQLPSNA